MHFTSSSFYLLSTTILGFITTTSADRDCCYVWQTDDRQAFRVSWTASSQSAICSAKGWGTDVKCSVEASIVDNAWLKAITTVSFKELNVFYFSFGINNNDCDYLGDDTIPRFWDSYLLTNPTYSTQKDVCPDGWF